MTDRRKKERCAPTEKKLVSNAIVIIGHREEKLPGNGCPSWSDGGQLQGWRGRKFQVLGGGEHPQRSGVRGDGFYLLKGGIYTESYGRGGETSLVGKVRDTIYEEKQTSAPLN